MRSRCRSTAIARRSSSCRRWAATATSRETGSRTIAAAMSRAVACGSWPSAQASPWAPARSVRSGQWMSRRPWRRCSASRWRTAREGRSPNWPSEHAMQFSAGLTGEAASLARQHSEVLARLPATIHAFILVELQKWPLLFGPEQRYQRALLDHLSRWSGGELDQAVSGIRRVESEAGVDRLGERSPARFQDESQALLRKRGLFVAWRQEVDAFFQRVEPEVEARIYAADAPRRLVVQIYGSGIAVQREKLWARFKGVGVRVPLILEGANAPQRFLEELFGTPNSSSRNRWGAFAPSSIKELFGTPEPGGHAPALLARATESAPLDAWLIESHEALHALCDASGASDGAAPASVTGLSYDRLRPYRDDLTRALNRKIQSGVESPQAFAAYARSLQIAPPAGALRIAFPSLPIPPARSWTSSSCRTTSG